MRNLSWTRLWGSSFWRLDSIERKRLRKMPKLPEFRVPLLSRLLPPRPPDVPQILSETRNSYFVNYRRRHYTLLTDKTIDRPWIILTIWPWRRSGSLQLDEHYLSSLAGIEFRVEGTKVFCDQLYAIEGFQ